MNGELLTEESWGRTLRAGSIGRKEGLKLKKELGRAQL